MGGWVDGVKMCPKVRDVIYGRPVKYCTASTNDDLAMRIHSEFTYNVTSFLDEP